MVIETFEHKYPVCCVKEINDKYESYICRNVTDGGLCSVLSLKDKRLFPGIIEGLTAIVNPGIFTDYLEHFIFEDKLCVVMRYRDGMSLENKLSTETVPLAEKMEIGRRILEKIIIRRIPDYFLAKSCHTKNIIIDRDLTPHFNYPIEDIEHMWKYTQGAAISYVKDLLREIFSAELKRRVPTVLMDFFDELPACFEKGGLIEVYSAYYNMMTMAIGNKTEEEPKTFWFIVWEKIKSAASRFKRVLLIVIVLAALGYLFYTIAGIGGREEKSDNFSSIGTVEIPKVNDNENSL